jgi:hypothetical protein
VTTPVSYVLYKLGAPLDLTEGSQFWYVEEFIVMTKGIQDTLRDLLPEAIHPIASIPIVVSAFIYAFPVETFVSGFLLIKIWFSLQLK